MKKQIPISEKSKTNGTKWNKIFFVKDIFHFALDKEDQLKCVPRLTLGSIEVVLYAAFVLTNYASLPQAARAGVGRQLRPDDSYRASADWMADSVSSQESERRVFYARPEGPAQEPRLLLDVQEIGHKSDSIPVNLNDIKLFQQLFSVEESKDLVWSSSTKRFSWYGVYVRKHNV